MPYRIRKSHEFWSDDARATEALLHQMLNRHRRDGEWFSLTQEIEHTLIGLWYVRTYEDGQVFHDLGGQTNTPFSFFRTQIKSLREEAVRSRAVTPTRREAGESQ